MKRARRILAGLLLVLILAPGFAAASAPECAFLEFVPDPSGTPERMIGHVVDCAWQWEEYTREEGTKRLSDVTQWAIEVVESIQDP